MSKDKEQQLRSQKVRDEVNAQRARRNTLTALAPVEFDADLIADPLDNTLSARYFQNAGQPLQFGIPAWDFAGLPGEDIIKLQLSRGGGAWETEETVILPSPQNPANFPYLFNLPRSRVELLGEGVHRFRYEVTDYTQQPIISAELALRFDLFPPYRTDKPAPFAALSNVTDATLLAGDDKVLLQLPPYPDWEEGDKVRWYWFNALPEDGGTMLPLGELQVPREGLTLGMTLEVPGDHVRRIGDGGCYAWYELEDKAGYVSKLSYHIAVGVALDPLPAVLAPPAVNLATGDDNYLIDTADAAQRVEVQVTQAPQIKPTDRIRVHWGDADLGWVPVGHGPRLLSFPIDPSILKTQYFDDPVGAVLTTGDKPTNVSYELMRGSVPLGGAAREINVNFETVGPLNPAWPSPINPALLAPTIRGAVSATDNALIEADENQPASLTLTLFEGVREGDLVEFYWGAELIDGTDYTVLSGDAQGDTKVVSIPWEAIARGGNGIVDVQYRVTRPGVPNPSSSVVQPVDVDAIIHTPGPVTFPGAVSGIVLACLSLYENPAAPHISEPAFRIKVPPLNPAPAIGTSLTLTWRVARNLDGLGGPIAEVDFTDRITLTDTQIREGFSWYVTWDRYIQPIYAISRDGRATVQYSYISGKLVTSQAAQIMVSPRNPGGICRIPPNVS